MTNAERIFQVIEEFNTCIKASNPSMARTIRLKCLGIERGGLPKGYTVDATCGDDLCVAEWHVYLRPWKSYGGKWTMLAQRLAVLPVGDYLDLEKYPQDAGAISRLRGGVGATSAGRMLKISVHHLPKGGVRITRTSSY